MTETSIILNFLGTAEEKKWYRKEDSLLHKGEEQIKEILERTIRGFSHWKMF